MRIVILGYIQCVAAVKWEKPPSPNPLLNWGQALRHSIIGYKLRNYLKYLLCVSISQPTCHLLRNVKYA